MSEASVPRRTLSVREHARALLIRGVGLVLALAHGSLWVQIDGLIGPRGLLPAAEWMDAVRPQLDPAGDATWRLVAAAPTLLWWIPLEPGLDVLCGVGLLAGLAAMFRLAEGPALATALVTYVSLETVSQRFLSFQWDTLLTEVTVATLLVARWHPWTTYRVPRAAWWLVWWILFRLVFFGGYVKLESADPTWWGATALTYHYETQPIPNPLSWYAHALPDSLHRLSVWATLGIELVLVFGIFLGRGLRLLAAFGIGALMLLLAATGNYGFFQLLTLILVGTLIDDPEWEDLSRWEPQLQPPPAPWPTRIAVSVVAVVLILLGAGRAATRHLGPESVPKPIQAANAALRPFRAVNNYGLFARMTTTRPTLVLEIQRDGAWEEVPWRWQPTELGAAPPFVAPHMPRLDWQLWFAALGNCGRNRWVHTLTQRVVDGEPAVLDLIGRPDLVLEPPEAARVRRYVYTFTDPGSHGASQGDWWSRTGGDLYCPSVGQRAADGQG